MSTILISGLIIAICSTGIEIYIFQNLATWRKIAIHGIRMGPVFLSDAVLGLVMSITLSWALGKLFGATGMTCLMAGLFSTGMSVCFYRAAHAWSQSGEAVKQQFKDIWTMFRVFTAPIRACRWIKTQYIKIRQIKTA